MAQDHWKNDPGPVPFASFCFVFHDLPGDVGSGPNLVGECGLTCGRVDDSKNGPALEKQMQTRREFIRQATLLSGIAGVWNGLPDSIQRAVAIAPDHGSTWRDAEHVVILMQENRSFDHAFGTLKGVRGFNDPRAITLPDGNPVWVQATAAGERYVPFRLNIRDTKSTWMGCLPHSWTDQVDAANKGRHDRWLQVKRSGTRAYAAMPLTLGFYTRQDIPFYYALADAFTICDQYFCSTLTGTTPNRLHLWSGTIRAKPTRDSYAHVLNSDCEHGAWVSWPTFPERLEDHGISWKIYQNELTIESGLTEDEDNWLANFGDNPIEYFTQFHVRHAANHRAFLEKRVKEIPGEIETLRKQLATESGKAATLTERHVADLTTKLKNYEAERQQWTAENFNKLSARDKKLYERAFVTNSADPSYRQLVEITYPDGDIQRKAQVPKGDIFYQFRKDVNDGTLPTVSWLVSPQKFSDHPSSAWYGAWYISEAMDILTRNSNVWKKTIFILTYDENDGYFDHVPPFMAPHPRRPETGLVTKGIDASVEYVEFEQDRKRKRADQARDNSMGLGFRVPTIIASPWTRGGCVCSQVFDHTSVLRFLEEFLTHKTGKKIEETNITRWRRAICGDLTSAFQAPTDDKNDQLHFLKRDAFVEEIDRAQFKELPTGYRALTKEETEQTRLTIPVSSVWFPKQEPGVRRSSPLPYQLNVDGSLNQERTRFMIRFEAKKELFGNRAAGAPFIVYAFSAKDDVVVRNYAVEAGEIIEDSWSLTDFTNGLYHIRVHGPNGFFRIFLGSHADPKTDLNIEYARAKTKEPALSGAVNIIAVNPDSQVTYQIEVRDYAYQNANLIGQIPPGGRQILTMDTEKSFGWYDFEVRISVQDRFVAKRYAGRVETGKWSWSDPYMGRVVK